MTISIRPEAVGDFDTVRQLHREAFGGDGEAALVDALRRDGMARVSLVAELAGAVVGHILFSELAIITDDGIVSALSLAPLAVLPDHQRQGVGASLVEAGLEQCRRLGHGIVIVLGHPEYYPKFGFKAELARPLAAPFGGRDAWMALELAPGALQGIAGWVRYPPQFGIGLQMRPAYKSDRPEWARMRRLLWPDANDHEAEIAALADSNVPYCNEWTLRTKTFVAELAEGGLCGFVETSLRPMVDGCSTSPVGYIEGWFVDAEHRRQGIGRKLIAAAEQWAVDNGCREMASDAELANVDSQAAHLAVGFAEVERMVLFSKSLDVATVESPTRKWKLPRMRLLDVAGTFAICKLPWEKPLPAWATQGDVFSVTRTLDEYSVVCRPELVPAGVLCESDWKGLRVAGSMPFSVVGVLASLTLAIAEAGIGVFAFSTFDTDYLLVKSADFARARSALQAAGHTVESPAMN